MTSNTKKESKSLTLKEKYDIIEYMEKYPDANQTRVAETFSHKLAKKVHRRSIKNYIDNKEKITEAYTKNCNIINIPRLAKYDVIDKKLWDWICIIEANGGIYSDAILKSKAVELANSEEIHDFKASNGWLQKFKLRHAIKERVLSGESDRINNNDFTEFYQKIAPTILKYTHENIYNCDETALFYRIMPSKSLVSKVRKGCKKFKDRLSILFCTNWDGSDKLKPFILGKSKNPRAFKSFKVDNFCRYSSNKNAWMTSNEFNMWLKDFDKIITKQKRKILLLMDNCPSHKITYESKSIEIIYLPKNSTAKTQPLDSGIIKSFKSKFYNYQLSNIVSRISPNVHVEELYKQLNIRDAVIYTKWAWNDVTRDTIRNCWRKAGFNDANFADSKDDIQEYSIIDYNILSNKLDFVDLVEQSELFEEFINEDDIIRSEADDSIVKMESTVDPDLCNDHVDCDLEDNKVNISEALEAFRKVKKYVIRDESVTDTLVEGLKLFENFLTKKNIGTKHTTILDYFNKD